MKSIFFKLLIILLASTLLILSCQKETKQSSENNPQSFASPVNANSCRMTVNDWPTAAKWEFHYNDKGLADEWIIDYGFGLPPHTNEMTYDDNNRLIRSEEFYFGSTYEYLFYYTGNKLTRLTRINVDNPADAVDVTYIYNSKGQNTRQDEVVYDSHVIMEYDNIGNCTRTDIYFGTELVYSDNYTFNIPSRNPRAAVPGVTTGFLAYGTAGMTDKWWFSSNRTEIYDPSGMFLFNDYDPAQTTMVTGNHNYPSSATYYDRVIEDNITITFDYENCNGDGSNSKMGNTQNNPPQGTKTAINVTRPLLRMGSAKSVKEQIQKLINAKTDLSKNF
jgi:hypothetical protein